MYTFMKAYEILRDNQKKFDDDPSKINKAFKEYSEIVADEQYRAIKVFIMKHDPNSKEFQQIFTL